MPNEVFDKIINTLFGREIAKTVLENGLTLLTKEDYSAQVISTQVWVKTGSIHENQYLGSGISHYLEHMLFKGTEKRDYKAITEDLQKVGAHINAYTTFDRTVYYVNGPIESFEISLDLLSDIIFHSVIDPIETAKEQNVILREIDMNLDDPDRQFSQLLFKTAFDKHPYRFPVIGERSLFQQLTRDDLLAYYKTRYVPNNMVLVIVGSCDKNKMFALAKKYFNKILPRPLAPTFIPGETPQLAPKTFYKTSNVEIVRGALAFKIPGLTHQDSPGLSILANLLGQGESSYLWQNLREKLNLVQDIDASIWNPGSSGLFIISYACDIGKRQEVENALSIELKNFCGTDLSSEKLQKTITQAIVNEINNRKTMSSQASKIGLLEVTIGDLYYSRIFIGKLETITPDQLHKLCKKYFILDSQVNVALEPYEIKHEQPISAVKKKIPDFEKITLKNGVRIIFQQFSNVPKVNIRIGLLGGPLYEDPKIRGATGVLATLLTKDTKERSAFQVAESIENIGGSFSEFVGNNTFGLNIEVLPIHFDLASDILKNGLVTPMFKESQFNIERNAQISAIRAELDDITTYGVRYLREIFFGDHPYASNTLGSIETLGNLTLSQVTQLHQSLLAPSNLVVSVAGEFDRAQIQDKLSLWAEAIPINPAISVDHFKFTNPPNPGDYQKVLDKEQVVVFEAYPDVGVTDPLFEVAELLDELFSGMSSNLFRKVREEKGMAYFIGTSRMIGAQTGMFYFYGGTSTKNYTKVFKEIENEIKRIQKGNISNEELDRCKICLISSQRLSLQTPSSRGSQALLDTIYGMDVNHWKNYTNRINAITKEHLQQFAIDHFQKSQRVRLAIGKVNPNRLL